MNTSFQLFQLQAIDSQIDQDKKRIVEITHTLMNNEEMDRVKETISKGEDEKKSINAEFTALNDEIQGKKNKLIQSESSLYSGTIHNPKELQDLQAEISSLKKMIALLEDDLIEILIRQEVIEEANQTSQEELKTIRTDFETQKALLLGEQKKLEENINGCLVKRDAVINQLDPNSIEIYKSLRIQKNGLAVARLNEDTCSACGTYLTASQCQEARSPSKLFICPSCGRILYG